MKHRLDCRIVQDLLPLYVDGLTCEYTNQEIEAHMAECSECAELLKRMQIPEKHIAEEAQVNYMKKIQKRMGKWKAVSGTFAVLLLSVLLLGIVLYSRLVPKDFEDVFGFEEDDLSYVELIDTTTFSRSVLGENELGEFTELLSNTEFYYEGKYGDTFEGYAYLLVLTDKTKEYSIDFHITEKLAIYYEGKEYSVRNDEALWGWIVRNVIDENGYVYPDEMNQNWNLIGVPERVLSCRIPESLSKHMSDEQLIEAILDSPFIIDVFVYDTPAYGVKNIENYCDAYAELVSRESAVDTLLILVKNRNEQFKNELSAEEEITNDTLACLIYYQEKFQEKLTEEDREFLKEFSNIIKSWEKEY